MFLLLELIFVGIVAQRLEQDAHNVLVVGSIPTNPTTLIEFIGFLNVGCVVSYLYFVSINIMPKIKTNSSSKKRFKVTATGRVKFKQAGKRHNLGKKSQKRIRNLRKSAVVEESFAANILKFQMPNSN